MWHTTMARPACSRETNLLITHNTCIAHYTMSMASCSSRQQQLTKNNRISQYNDNIDNINEMM